MTPARLFILTWLAWAVSWLAASLWSNRTERRAPGSAQWIHRIITYAGAVLLYHRTGEALGAEKLWHVGFTGAYALVGATVAGVVFAWWARLHLGRLWSGTVTLKEGHRVIDTGPYALVRHPIYTGLILSTLATGAAVATLPAIAGVALVVIGLWLKARLEERFLSAELGADAYGAYRRRVPMLLPFGPT